MIYFASITDDHQYKGGLISCHIPSDNSNKVNKHYNYIGVFKIDNKYKLCPDNCFS